MLLSDTPSRIFLLTTLSTVSYSSGPEDLLPPPWSHLLSSIPLPPSSTHIYRPASFISSSSNKDALRISIPTGDATLGFPTQLITVLAVLAAAVWVANVTRRVLNSVASVEREAEKGKYRRVDRLKGE